MIMMIDDIVVIVMLNHDMLHVCCNALCIVHCALLHRGMMSDECISKSISYQ